MSSIVFGKVSQNAQDVVGEAGRQVHGARRRAGNNWRAGARRETRS